jgi:hypothetical protein
VREKILQAELGKLAMKEQMVSWMESLQRTQV